MSRPLPMLLRDFDKKNNTEGGAFPLGETKNSSTAESI